MVGVTETHESDDRESQPVDGGRASSAADEGAPKEAGTQRRGGGRSSSRGLYAALIATVGVAAFFAGLAVPVLNQDPITMSDLNQAVVFLEDKIDKLSNDLQELEDTMLTDPDASSTSSPQPAISADDDPVLGNPDAPVTIIEFSDFQCPFCARFHSETLPHIIENYVDTGQAKLVYRDFPLQNIHPNAVPAAVAAECADEQGMYWEYHDTLFENVAVWGGLDLASAVGQFEAYAAEMGLDEGSFSECLETGRYISEVTNDYTDGASYGVSGTPAFFLGNDQVGYYYISGARPYSEFQFAIEQILSSIEQ
ncbi:MAG: DsbA family protein [Proteobacteria bacterium]|nr:DsbA family protein [Pseudomonadota bacterium]